MIPHLFDIILLAVLAFFIYRGYSRGPLRMVVRLAGSLLSVVLARFAASVLTPVIADSMPIDIGGAFAAFLRTNLSISDQTQTNLVKILSDWGFPSRAAGRLADSVGSGVSGTADAITNTLSPQIGRMLAFILVFIFVWILLMIVFSLLASAIDNVIKHTPIIGTLYRFAGMGLGLLCGLALVFVVCLMVQWLAPVLDTGFDTKLSAIVEQSWIVSMLKHINPLNLII